MESAKTLTVLLRVYFNKASFVCFIYARFNKSLYSTFFAVKPSSNTASVRFGLRFHYISRLLAFNNNLKRTNSQRALEHFCSPPSEINVLWNLSYVTPNSLFYYKLPSLAPSSKTECNFIVCSLVNKMIK